MCVKASRHSTKKDISVSPEKNDGTQRNKDVSVSSEKDCGAHGDQVSCAQVSITQESCSLTGGGEPECVLSIVPVKIKLKKSDKLVETFAFIDPGSTATFCTGDLQKKLNVKGKPTRLLLSTMGQNEPEEQKVINSYVISDLEVCGLEDTKYIDLPKVYTHSSIPVHTNNIPKQSDIEEWPYLKQVHLPELKAEVGLLIVANCPKAIEPWHIINSRDGGLYAVKTAIGWIVSGPMRKELDDTENKSNQCSVNRISVMEIEKMLVQQYNTEFSECSYNEKEELSQEDKLFMQSVQNTTTLENEHYSIGLPLRNKKLQMPNNRCVATAHSQFAQKIQEESCVF